MLSKWKTIPTNAASIIETSTGASRFKHPHKLWLDYVFASFLDKCREQLQYVHESLLNQDFTVVFHLLVEEYKRSTREDPDEMAVQAIWNAILTFLTQFIGHKFLAIQNFRPDSTFTEVFNTCVSDKIGDLSLLRGNTAKENTTTKRSADNNKSGKRNKKNEGKKLPTTKYIQRPGRRHKMM